jgi:hypothetical protein
LDGLVRKRGSEKGEKGEMERKQGSENEEEKKYLCALAEIRHSAASMSRMTGINFRLTISIHFTTVWMASGLLITCSIPVEAFIHLF